jgi:hypothetical protein
MVEVALRLDAYDWTEMPAPDELFERADVVRAHSRALRRESGMLRATAGWETRRLHRTRRRRDAAELHWVGSDGLDDIYV